MDRPLSLRSFIPVIFLSILTACSYFSEEKMLERNTAIDYGVRVLPVCGDFVRVHGKRPINHALSV